MEEQEKNKRNFSGIKKFMNKFGFYIGILVIIAIAVIVVSSDNRVVFKGSVKYESPVYYVHNNMLFLKEHGNEAILISRNLLKEWSISEANTVLVSVQITPDQTRMFFLENINFKQSTYFGDLYVYSDGKKELIGENAILEYVVSDDYDTVLYVSVSFTEEGKSYDLYKYNKESGTEHIDSNVDFICFTLSGNGNVAVYHKDYSYVNNTTSMYVHQDGESILVADDAHLHGKHNPSGTFRNNWPIINRDGTRILYVARPEANEMLDAYIYESGSTRIIGQSITQIYADEPVQTVLMIENASIEKKSGDMVRMDLSTGNKETVAKNVWGLTDIYTARMMDSTFIQRNIYFKNYLDMVNAADIYYMMDGQEILLGSKVAVNKVQYSQNYMNFTTMEYYSEDSGGTIIHVSFQENGEYVKFTGNDDTKEVRVTNDGRHKAYVSGGTLFLLDEDNKKSMIEISDVFNYEFMEDGDKLVYFKRRELTGDIKVQFLYGQKNNEVIAQDVTSAWDFRENGYIAFLAFYDFSTDAGTMVLTDARGNYEIIAEKVNAHLIHSFIY
ncbi:MAG: hypothetical protein R6W96_03485 [Clostridia bacterium]